MLKILTEGEEQCQYVDRAIDKVGPLIERHFDAMQPIALLHVRCGCGLKVKL